MLLSIPNLLTLSRIVVIPLFVSAFWLEGVAANWIAFGIFAFASITDFFDGYLAHLNKIMAGFDSKKTNTK